MKEMAIHVDGKYDYKFKIIRAVYYLSYKDAVMKKVEYIYQEGSPARAQLYSLYLALQHVKEPCIINIYSKFPLGFKQPKKCNSKDLIVKILNLVNKAGHIVKFNIDKEFYQVQMWEQVYGTKVPNTKPAEAVETVEDIFSIAEDDILSKEEQLRKEYEELNTSTSVWVPGSGGY